MNKMFAPRMRKVGTLPLLMLIATLAAPSVARVAGQKQHKAPAPRSLRLYVFDCGNLKIDPTPYGFTKDDLATTDMSVPCFLAAHPKGTLMWDTGVLPDTVFPPPGTVTQGRAPVPNPPNPHLPAP